MRKSNYSKQALSDCIIALKCPEWHIRLIHTDVTMPVIDRTYTPNQLYRSSAFLRIKNYEGYNIYGRPITMRHVLVDDIDEYTLTQMSEDGLQPALVVETSPNNLQAWVTVSRNGITYTEATSAAKLLAQQYGGDPGAAKGNQLGRLPSFTNRKPVHQMADGLYPYAKIVRQFHPCVATGGARLLKEARLTPYFVRFSSPEGRACVHHDAINISTDMTPDEAISIYNGTVDELTKQFWLDQPDDRSLVDYSIARYLFTQYGYYIEDVAAVILHGSDKGRERGEQYSIDTAIAASHSKIQEAV